jgi:hypothetical protein
MDAPRTDRRPLWSRISEPEMLIAMSAVLIGACALVVSVVQVQIMREEQHASVWPRLHVSQSYAQGTNLGISLVNPGIGPAVIKHIKVSVDGVSRTTWKSVLEALVPAHPPRDLALSTISQRIVPAGEEVVALHTADPQLADALAQALAKLSMELCYCSVYDDCWIVAANFGVGLAPSPRPVSACPAASADMFVD